VLSLCLCAAAALVFGVFAWLATARPLAGAVACLAFIVHPSMTTAAVAWVMNQMHLLEAITICGGLIWWFLVRRRSAAWWLPLLGFEVTALLIKEDGILLLPAIVLLHSARRRIIEPDLPRIPRGPLVAVTVSALALFGFRLFVLESLGGYSHLTVTRVLHEPAALAWHGLRYQLESLRGVFGLSDPPFRWPPAASAFALVLVAAAIACWRHASANARYVIVSGIIVTLLFDAPTLLGTKPQQLHMIAAGTALLFTGSAIAMLDAARTPMLRTSVAALLTMSAIAMALASRTLGARYEPFSSDVLATDEKVLAWDRVPVELRDYVRRKRDPAAADRVGANPAYAVDAVTFRVADGRLDVYVRRNATAADVPLRRSPEEVTGSARVEVRADGRLVATIEIEGREWRIARVPLVPAAASRAGQMHRVVITSAGGAIESSAVVVR
jgi:hypothetical protein